VSYQITIKNSGKTFSANSDETVLEAAMRQGIHLPYGCKNGACGSCKGKVESGCVSHGDHNEKALSGEEALNSMALFCCAKAESDLVIDVREVEAHGDVVIKKIPCRVASLNRVTDDVVIVKLQLPATEKFQFVAGQYIEFLLKDKRRAYSIASAPHEEGPLELHIRHMPGGAFTDFVFGSSESGTMMKEKDILRFEGPLGSFFLREDSNKPIIFIASGTGFAPIKGIVEHIRHQASHAQSSFTGAVVVQKTSITTSYAKPGQKKFLALNTFQLFLMHFQKISGMAEQGLFMLRR